MNGRNWIVTGALAAALAVLLGAFGAHALESRVSAALLAVFETGARYQMYHALGLIAVGVVAGRRSSPALRLSGWAFLSGIALFCGSLYIMALTGARWLGAITPFGGLAFVVGWLALAVGARRSG